MKLIVCRENFWDHNENQFLTCSLIKIEKIIFLLFYFYFLALIFQRVRQVKNDRAHFGSFQPVAVNCKNWLISSIILNSFLFRKIQFKFQKKYLLSTQPWKICTQVSLKAFVKRWEKFFDVTCYLVREFHLNWISFVTARTAWQTLKLNFNHLIIQIL